MKELMEKNKDKNTKESEFKDIDKDILEKQAELEKLFEELMDDDMKKLLEKMKDLLEKTKKTNYRNKWISLNLTIKS